MNASMLRVLLCSERDLRPDLRGTLIGRLGIEVYRAARFEDAQLLCKTLGARVVLVDRDLPSAESLIRRLRQDPATRPRSVAVLARGGESAQESELLSAGANAIFRLPPDVGWDERLQRLLSVPVRQAARLVVHIEVDTEPECAAAMLNLSAGGMLIATGHRLEVNDELGFRFRVPFGTSVEGRARVTREAPPTGYGVEFLRVSDQNAIGEYLRSAQLGS
jgi:CheY-like chemotaxis protein